MILLFRDPWYSIIQTMFTVPLDVPLDPYFTFSKCEDLVDQDQSTLV
jgi:hypothetical protein